MMGGRPDDWGLRSVYFYRIDIVGRSFLCTRILSLGSFFFPLMVIWRLSNGGGVDGC